MYASAVRKALAEFGRPERPMRPGDLVLVTYAGRRMNEEDFRVEQDTLLPRRI